jgi:uncharacterized repeat protein (TIGR01451 family)
MLALTPSSARAQVTPPPPTIDKECSPNPVQIGEQLTCTIDVEPPDPQTFALVEVTDTLPAGVITVSEATQQQLVNGVVVLTQPCTVTGNIVTCPPGIVAGEAIIPARTSVRVTIEATAEQCGTFTNIAEAEDFTDPPANVEDTEEFTVVGCEGAAPGGQPNQVQGVPGPITQEGEQESESGEIDQSFDVS